MFKTTTTIYNSTKKNQDILIYCNYILQNYKLN